MLILGNCRSRYKKSSIVAEGGGVGSTITHTGSGFGTKSPLEPVFYDFLERTSFTDGAAIATRGFLAPGGGVVLRNTDGPTDDTGCIESISTAGSEDSFVHLHYPFSGAGYKKVFAMWNSKLERISGTAGTGSFQEKGPRFTFDSGADDPEYNGVPRFTSSYYHDRDMSSLDFANMGHVSSFEDLAGDDFGVTPSSDYRDRYVSGGWNLFEGVLDLGDVSTANGYWHHWYNGAPLHPFSSDVLGGGVISENCTMRASSDQLLQFVHIFPGLDGITPNDVYRARFAGIYVDSTEARIVLGNASAWSACTQKIPLIATAWSDGSVTATMRAFPGVSAGGTVYSYVVNSSGTVSSGVARTAI